MTTPGPRDGGTEVGLDLARLGAFLTHVVTPTTLVAALMVYFGSVRTNTAFRSLGVDPSVLGLSLQDYALRSVGTTIEPLAVVLLALLVALPAHLLLMRLMAARPGVLRRAATVLGLLGLAGAAVGVLNMVGWAEPLPRGPAVPILLGLSVLALGYSASIRAATGSRRESRVTEPPTIRTVRRGVFVALLLLLLLWAVAGYAELRGHAVVDTFRRKPATLPGVVVYAPQRLYLEGPGVTETLLPDASAKFRYRYAGLRLLIRANERYFLLPACWATAPQARAVALPDDPAIRVEFFLVTTPPACP